LVDDEFASWLIDEIDPYLDEDDRSSLLGNCALFILFVIWLFKLLISLLLFSWLFKMVLVVQIDWSSLWFLLFTNNRLDSFVSSSSFASCSTMLLFVAFLVGPVSESSLSDSGSPGMTRRLQTGQQRLFLRSHLSMHSIW